MNTQSDNRIPRPPIVTVMGHIDHGKSTLLDFIRSTKVTETEAGGITQHISAYEAEHPTAGGQSRTITFLDTPGHEAFQHLRSRGSQAADLAILVVAADDGVKPQTMEALRAINEAGIPYLVAITKIDKNNADVERTKASLLEHGIYLEGMGGDVSYVPISSKTGEGVSQLLDLVLLAADLEELTGDPEKPAEGLVIESHCDPRRGVSAVVVIRDGSLKIGEYIVAGGAYAPLRIVENFLGKSVKQATFSSPLMVVGFSDIPPVGAVFSTVKDKKSAVALARESAVATAPCMAVSDEEDERFVLPVIVKGDVVGSLDAIRHEMQKFDDDRTVIRVVHEGIGAVSEGDVKAAIADKRTVVIGFNVGVDAPARELAERHNVEVVSFSIIYDLTDWLPGAIAARRPKVAREVETGRAKLLKSFSVTHKMQTVGLRVESGALTVGDSIAYLHAGEEVARGTVQSLKNGPSDVQKIDAGNDCGAQLELQLEALPVYGDVVVAQHMVEE